MQPTFLSLPSGVTLATYEAGDPAGTPVIFVHGNSLAASIFIRQFEAPELQHLRLLALDLPGCGASPWAPAHYYPRQLQAVLCEATRALSAAAPVLVGHSYGGHLALDAMPQLPGLRGVLAVGTPPVKVPDSLSAAFAFDERGLLFYQQEVSETDLTIMCTHCLGPQATAGARAVVSAALHQADGRFRAALGAALAAGGEIPDELAIIRDTPVLLAFAAGEADQLLHFNYFDTLAAPSRWGVPLHLVPAAGHTPFLENSAAFNDLLLRFVAATPPRSAL
ncbi:alpha/beta fold hydrolase [Hymenobacter cheonanensis]|uniref:alpha/beta fold hydrolase n=1 Tax=Hymenobacter sp. CA2-7 TaxID=3063993 RepID=UPI0027129A86|nr:alpha/beta hydrolase [Hymenobacter sp. CA2-7]MDO7884313.1 alpha/beta hydrolase [Hymenobacter sp. CA2-7]